MATWSCMKQCGACCHLDPEDRPNLADYLSPEEIDLYLSLVGTDGWCIHYDASLRQCRIYEQRPQFCRVEPDNFQRMYGVTAPEFNDFAIACCYQQIECVYGSESQERESYARLVSG